MKHKLSNIDLEKRSADCGHCAGLVRVKLRNGRAYCDQVLRSDVPERRSRSHYLRDIDSDALTATCLQCGPTKIRRHTSGTVPWRCEFRAKQSNDWKSHYEHPDPHVRDSMRINHGQHCDICEKIMSQEHQGNSLNYDHNHVTGKFRGWLCPNCNKAIGLLEDNPILFRLAAGYLEKFVEDVNDTY